MTIASGRKVVITGGASGFGLDVARELIIAGARVAIMDVSVDRLASASKILGTSCLPIQADVRNPVNVKEAMTQASDSFGGLDTLVISAGVIHLKPMSEVSEADWDLTLDVNLKGAFFAIQAAAPYLLASGRGRIVAISSDAGRRGFSQSQAYCASKFGLVGLIESTAVELAHGQVTVNCVCPVGCPTTSMGEEVLDWKKSHTDKSAAEIMASTAQGNPLGRNASERDVTQSILFFISEEANFLTGTSLDVDGGAHLGFLPGVSA